MASSNSKKVIQTEPNSFCCPTWQYIPYETCVPLRSVGAGTPVGVLNLVLREVVGVTIYSSPESTGTASITTRVGVTNVLLSSLTPGNSVTFLGQTREISITVPTGGVFIGTACVKIYAGIPS